MAETDFRYLSNAIVHKFKDDLRQALKPYAEEALEKAVENIAGEIELYSKHIKDLSSFSDKIIVELNDKRSK